MKLRDSFGNEKRELRVSKEEETPKKSEKTIECQVKTEERPTKSPFLKRKSLASAIMGQSGAFETLKEPISSEKIGQHTTSTFWDSKTKKLPSGHLVLGNNILSMTGTIENDMMVGEYSVVDSIRNSMQLRKRKKISRFEILGNSIQHRASIALNGKLVPPLKLSGFEKTATKSLSSFRSLKEKMRSPKKEENQPKPVENVSKGVLRFGSMTQRGSVESGETPFGSFIVKNQSPLAMRSKERRKSIESSKFKASFDTIHRFTRKSKERKIELIGTIMKK